MNKRLVEVDILRGLSILGMILVITPGDWSARFEWMNHAQWSGFPLSDTIFPTFLFCVGVSIALSFSKKIKTGKTFRYLIFKVFKRVLLLVIIGVFVNGFPYFDWSHLRLPGILQRIGCCYLIASSIWLAILYFKSQSEILWLIFSSIIILFAYYVLLYHIPVFENGITGHSPVNSWPVYVDQNLFGINHLWIYGKTNGIVTFDPDGLLASIPASVNTILGILMGTLYNKYPQYYKVGYLIIIGTIIMLMGVLLNYFNIIPVIKNIWTSSFVLVSGGFSILAFTLIMGLINTIKISQYVFYPFVVYGANALIAFVISNLLMNVMDIEIINGVSFRQKGFQLFKSIFTEPKLASLMFSITFLALLFLGLQGMYKNKWFVKL